MPFYRKFRYPQSQKYMRKRVYARKRQSANVAKSKALSAVYRQPTTLNSSTTFSVRRMIKFSAPIVFSASFQDGLVAFRLADLPGASEFTALYDQYKVDKFCVHFVPWQSVSETGGVDPGTLLTAVDFDGGATGLTQSQFLEYESCQVTPIWQSKKVCVQPRAELNATDSNATVVSAAVAPRSTWWDCSNTAIYHYGVRWGAVPDGVLTSNHFGYNIWMEVFLTFKATR